MYIILIECLIIYDQTAKFGLFFAKVYRQIDFFYSKNIYKAVIPEKEFTYLNEELTDKYIKML